MAQQLIATRSFKYSTRRLKPGDIFEASDKDARLLLAIKKARNARPSADITAPPRSIAAKIRSAIAPAAAPAAAPSAPVDPAPVRPLPQTQPNASEATIAALREEYRSIVGKPAFNRWDAAELHKRIDEAKAAKPA